MADFDLFEIMRITHSMRRLKTDPVPDTLLSRILECGLPASGGNMQAWRFRDPRSKIKEAAGGGTQGRPSCGTTISIRRTGTGRDA